MEYTVHFYLIFISSLLVAGIIAGVIAGLLGIGGGLVLVPVMFYLFTQMGVDASVCMHMAVGTSLASIVVTSMSSSHSHYKKGSVEISVLKHWAFWLILGSVIAMSIFGSIKTAGLTMFFSAMTFAIAMYMLFGPTFKNPEDSVGKLPAGPKGWLSGMLVSGIASVMGIGGGSLTVPLLSYFKYPMRKAVGTSSAVGLLIAIPGTIGAIVSGYGQSVLPPFSLGYVNLLAFIVLVPMTALCAPIGVKFANTIKPEYLRYAFILFLLINAVTMLIKSL